MVSLQNAKSLAAARNRGRAVDFAVFAFDGRAGLFVERLVFGQRRARHRRPAAARTAVGLDEGAVPVAPAGPVLGPDLDMNADADQPFERFEMTGLGGETQARGIAARGRHVKIVDPSIAEHQIGFPHIKAIPPIGVADDPDLLPRRGPLPASGHRELENSQIGAAAAFGDDAGRVQDRCFGAAQRTTMARDAFKNDRGVLDRGLVHGRRQAAPSEDGTRRIEAQYDQDRGDDAWFLHDSSFPQPFYFLVLSVSVPPL